LILGTEKSDRN